MKFEANTVKRAASTLIALGVVAAIGGCGEEAQTTLPISADPQIEPIPAAPMSSYSGPGSVWQYDLNTDGTFAVSRNLGTDSELVVTGSYQATAAGFLSMSVDSASGTNADSVGDSLWALEVPNVLMLLSPVSAAEDSYVPMVSGRECPNSDFTTNWISVKYVGDGNAAQDDGAFFGMFSYSASQNSAALLSQHALTSSNPDQGARPLGHGYCNGGIVHTDDSVVHVSVSGAAVAEVGALDGSGGPFLVALPTQTMASIDDFDGSYVGVFSDHGSGGGSSMSPVSVSCAAGICSGSVIDDIQAGTTSGDTFTVDLFGSTNDPSIGFITGSLNVGDSSSNLACTVDAEVDATGQRMISCVGQSPTADYRTANVILVSND